jgi:uncharacterized protein
MRKSANASRRGVAERAKRWKAAARSIGLDAALEVLRRHRERLSSMGVVHAGIFGSLARGDAGKRSDIDIFVVRELGVYEFVGTQHFLQDVLHPRVDLIERDAVKPAIRERLFAHAVNAF